MTATGSARGGEPKRSLEQTACLGALAARASGREGEGGRELAEVDGLAGRLAFAGRWIQEKIKQGMGKQARLRSGPAARDRGLNEGLREVAQISQPKRRRKKNTGRSSQLVQHTQNSFSGEHASNRSREPRAIRGLGIASRQANRRAKGGSDEAEESIRTGGSARHLTTSSGRAMTLGRVAVAQPST